TFSVVFFFLSVSLHSPTFTLFAYTTLFRSSLYSDSLCSQFLLLLESCSDSHWHVYLWFLPWSLVLLRVVYWQVLAFREPWTRLTMAWAAVPKLPWLTVF